MGSAPSFISRECTYLRILFRQTLDRSEIQQLDQRRSDRQNMRPPCGMRMNHCRIVSS